MTATSNDTSIDPAPFFVGLDVGVFDGELDGNTVALCRPDGASEGKADEDLVGGKDVDGATESVGLELGCNDKLGSPDGADVGFFVGVFDGELDGSTDGAKEDLVGIKDMDGATEPALLGVGYDDELGFPDGTDVGLVVADGEEVLPTVGPSDAVSSPDGASEGEAEDDLVGIRDTD